jgi:hypothetical protein
MYALVIVAVAAGVVGVITPRLLDRHLTDAVREDVTDLGMPPPFVYVLPSSYRPGHKRFVVVAWLAALLCLFSLLVLVRRL